MSAVAAPAGQLDLPAWRPYTHTAFGPGIALDIHGDTAWFCSEDVALDPAPEAAVCLLAYPCLATGTDLRITGARPAPDFLANARSATDLMAGWWGLPPLRYAGAAAGPSAPPVRPVSGRGTALFFSGGVDSFYSLLRHPGPIDTLVYVIGLDVRLANRAAADAMIEDFRRLARDRGLRLITLATNLRDHPFLGAQRWVRYCGAGKAVAMHLLRREAAHFILSSSFHESHMPLVGSHPDLDWRWGDGRVSLEHFGADAWRTEKLLAIAGEPAVHDMLRVCYPTPPVGGNCGRCEKCLRTRLAYHACLPGARCRTMPDGPPLAEALDTIARVDEPMLTEAYRWVLDHGRPDPAVRRSVEALIARSQSRGTAG